MSSVKTIGLLIVAAAAGFYAHDYLPNADADKNESHFSFQDADPKDVKPVEPNQEFACKFKGWALAGEYKLGDPHSWAHQLGKVQGPDVEVQYARESEAVALRISNDGKGIFMLTATDVSMGVSGASRPFPIIDNGPNYLVAADESDTLAIHTLLMDKKTLRAIYSYTGLTGSGIAGESHVLECH